MKSTLISTPFTNKRDIVKAEGNYYYDSKGKKILDLESGIWCASIGHNPPEIKKIIKTQLDSLTHIGKRLLPIEIDRVSQKLLDLSGIKGKVLFLNTGSEAIEFSIITAKIKNPKAKLVCLKNNYVTAYGQASDPDEIIDIQACFSCENDCSESCSVLKNKINKNDIFIFDPFSFSRQVLTPPTKCIEKIDEILKKNDGLMIADEITTGMGRCGKWFGYQYYNIEPNAVVLGKSLGNGYPVSAIIIDENIVNTLENEHFMYYQSHQNDPMGYKIAEQVVSCIEEKNLIAQVNEKGQYFFNALNSELLEFDSIVDIRGIGLMLSIELSKEIDPNKVFDKMLEKNIFMGTSATYNTLNFFPTYIIEKHQIDKTIDELKSILPNI